MTNVIGGAIVFGLLVVAALVARRGHWRKIRVGVFLEREPLDGHADDGNGDGGAAPPPTG